MRLKRLFQKIRYGSNFHKPRYMLQLINNIIGQKYFRRHPLRGVEFALDYKCNLRCKHCFNEFLTKNSPKMQLRDYARVIKEAQSLGAVNFAFQGGEILICEGYEDLLKLVDAKRYSLAITTNGLLLTKAIAKKLKKIGVNTVAVSLDSGLACEHDAFRGREGSFKAATEGIKDLLESGIKVFINSTVTPVSLYSEGFKKLLRYAEEMKILINTIFVTPSGRWFHSKEPFLSEKDIAYYNRLVADKHFVVRDLDTGYTKRGCQAATEAIYITPYGDMLPCPFIHIKAGNIFSESLDVIRKRAMKYFHYQDRCLISENKAFIQEYIQLIQDQTLPLPEDNFAKISAW